MKSGEGRSGPAESETTNTDDKKILCPPAISVKAAMYGPPFSSW
jgi:hypothetical protein